jgi:hypothetical protein
MSDIFFFTDLDLVDKIPGPGNEFGPTTDNRYNLTSWHKSNSAKIPNAYAILDGTIAIVPVDRNSNIVNIVLRPSKQISQITSQNFAPIKYIIYRGINLNSVFGEKKTDSPLQYTLQYPKTIPNNAYFEIIKQFNKLNSDNKEEKDKKIANSNILRTNIAASLTNSDLIDNLFSINNNQDVFVDKFQLPEIKAGSYIGDFNNEKFGIEIILDGVLSNPTMSIAKNKDNYIQNPVTGTELQKKVIKEQVLHYMDVAAFYGSLTNSPRGVKSRKNTDGNSTIHTDREIYTEILASFVNKDKIYIDVRNNFNRSFNYFKNYYDTINLEILNGNGSTPSSKLFAQNLYQDASWPIIILNKDNLPDGIINKTILVNLLLPNTRLDGNVLKIINSDPLIYISQGYINNEIKDSGNIEDKRYDLKGNKKSIKGQSLIQLIIENNIEGKNPISSYIRIKYIEAAYGTLTEPSIIPDYKSNYDWLFAPLSLGLNFEKVINNTTEKYKVITKVFNEERYFKTDLGSSYFTSIGYGEDEKMYSLFAFAKDKSPGDNSKTAPINLVSDISKSYNSFIQYLDQKFSKHRIEKSTRVIDGGTKYILQFKKYDSEVSGSRLKIIESKPDEEMVLFLFKKQSIKSLFQNIGLDAEKIDPKLDVFLRITERVSNVDGDGKKYTKITVKLAGFKNADSSLIELGSINCYAMGADDKSNEKQSLIFVDENLTASDIVLDDNIDLVNRVCPTPVYTGTGSLEAFKAEIASSSHIPTIQIRTKIFDYLTINNNNSITSIIPPANMPWLPEGCLIYTMWKYAILLKKFCDNTSETIFNTDNELVKYLVNELTYKIDSKTKKSGMFIDSGFTTSEEKDKINSIWKKLLNSYRSLNGRILDLDELIDVTVDGKPSKTNKKYYIDSDDNYGKIVFITKLIMLSNEKCITFLDFESNCLYKKITNQINIKLPKSKILACGDGGGTNGILGYGNFCVVFFNYNISNIKTNSIVGLKNEQIFNLSRFHINLFGVNNNTTQSFIQIYINKNEVCVFVKGSETSQPSFTPCDFKVLNPKPKISLASYSALTPIVSSNPNVTFFTNSSGKRIGSYSIDSQVFQFLEFSPINQYFVVVEDVPKKDEEEKDTDEIMLIVNNLQPDSNHFLNIQVNDLFESDSFTIKGEGKSKLDNQLDNQAAAIQDIADKINALEPEQNVFDENVFFELTPLFVGKEEKNKIVSDSAYYFNMAKTNSKFQSERTSYNDTKEKADLGKLRSSSFKNHFFDSKSILFTISSSVDPVRSRLDKLDRWKNNPDINSLIETLNSFTNFGANDLDIALNDDYLEVIENNQTKKIPSYNALLCSLRSFAIMKYVIERIKTRINLPVSGLGQNNRHDLLQQVVANTIVYQNTKIGLAKNVTYSDYLYFVNETNL